MMQVVPSGSGTYQIGDPIVLAGQVSDYDGDQLSYEWFIDGEFQYDGQVESAVDGVPVDQPEHLLWGLDTGIYTVTLAVNDGFSEPVSKDIIIEIIDTIAPTLAPVADTNMLWPPNHKMIDVAIATNASDNSGEKITLSVAIFSNEPEDGIGDGQTESDWEITEIDETNGLIYLQLRAERSGTGDERAYTVTISATDEAGNNSSSDVEIIVPHDKRGKNK